MNYTENIVCNTISVANDELPPSVCELTRFLPGPIIFEKSTFSDKNVY